MIFLVQRLNLRLRLMQDLMFGKLTIIITEMNLQASGLC